MLKNIFKKKAHREKIIDEIKSKKSSKIMIKEAKENPDDWVYAIHGNYTESEADPPNAIIGAWKVDDSGNLTDEFKENPNFDPSK